MALGAHDISALVQVDKLSIHTTISIVTEGLVTLANRTVANITEECIKEKVGQEYLVPWRKFTFWCLAYIIPVGLILNCISIGVYMTSWMRRGVPGRYFIALSLADNLVLLGELFLWLNTDIEGPVLGLDFIHYSDFFCKLTHFLRYGARMWSSWITVAITVERFLTVTFPLKMVRLSSPRKAVVVIVTIGIVCFSLGSFPFFTLGAGFYKKRPLCQYTNRKLYAIWTSVVIAIFGEMVVPSLVVTIFTALIIWRLAIARRARLRMVEGSNTNHATHWRQKASERQPTIALLSIAVMFVTIRMPYIIMYFLNTYKDDLWDCLNKWQSFAIHIIYTVAKVLAVLNYSLNFCLYCISGAPFRKELKRCITCRRWQRQTIRTGSYVLSTRINRDTVSSCRSPYSPHSTSPRQASPKPASNPEGDKTKNRINHGNNLDVGEKMAMLHGHDSIDEIKDCIADYTKEGISKRKEKHNNALSATDNDHVAGNENLYDWENMEGVRLNGNDGERSKAVLVVMETTPSGVITRL